MKLSVAVLFALVAFAYAAEEKKQEKRGIIDFGHGHSDLHLSHADVGYSGISYAHAAPLTVAAAPVHHDLGLHSGYSAPHYSVAAAPIHHDFGLHSVHSAPLITKTVAAPVIEKTLVSAHAHGIPAVAKSYASLTFGTAPVIAKTVAAPVIAKSYAAPIVTKSYYSEPSYSAPIVSAPLLTKTYAAAAPIVSAHHSYEPHYISAPIVAKSYSTPIVAKSYAAPVIASHSYAAPLSYHGHHGAYGYSFDGHYGHH